MSLCEHGINLKHKRCDNCEEIAEAEMKLSARLRPGTPFPQNRPTEHDLDGTPLPAGHQEYTAEQERFDVLWKKWADGTITPDEKAEMLKMQEKYWDHKHEQ